MRDGWVETTLGEVATTVGPSKSTEPTRYVGLEHFDSGSPRLTRWGSTEDFTSMTTAFKRGEVLFSKLRPYLRKVAVAEWDGRCTTESLVYRPSDAKLSAAYLGLVMQSDQAIVHADASSAGSRMPRTSVKIMSSLPLLLPPLKEQERIVDLIGSLDDTVAAGSTLEDRTKTILRQLPAAITALGVSHGWDIQRLADVLGDPSAIRTGPFGSQLHQKDYTPDGQVAVVMPANMVGGRVDVESCAKIERVDAERLSRHLTRKGDILWSRRGDVTRFAVIDEASSGSLCGTGCFLLRPRFDADSRWLEVLLSAPETGHWLMDHAVGATMANLNRDILGNIPVLVPPEDRRQALADSWSSLRQVERTGSSAIASLQALRSNVLTALLSGEHEIPESYDQLIQEAS